MTTVLEKTMTGVGPSRSITRSVNDDEEEEEREISNIQFAPRLATTLIAIIYSTVLNLSFPQKETNPGLPSLPLRHSSLATLLPHVIFESIFISQLSHSTLSSFGACLHLLKIPLLSTVFRYFKIGFQTEICRSLTFDLLNYTGQFLLFYLLSTTASKVPTARKKKIYKNKNRNAQECTLVSKPQEEGNHEHEEDSRRESSPKTSELEREVQTERAEMMERLKENQRQKNMIYMSALSWILISVVDGLFNFAFEKTLTPKIEVDVQEHLKKLEIDEYFLLKSPGTIPPVDQILRSMSPQDRPMVQHQLISLLINLPYFFSSASMISVPSDFILLDRLPMLSINTKLQWLLGLVLRRVLNSSLAYYFQT